MLGSDSRSMPTLLPDCKRALFKSVVRVKQNECLEWAWIARDPKNVVSFGEVKVALMVPLLMPILNPSLIEPNAI